MENKLSLQNIEEVSHTIRDWLCNSGTTKNWYECKEYWIKDVSGSLFDKLHKKGYEIVKIKKL